jgi:threonylcarbamoyladenosine tRNA methylthiotransferase MtaB
MEKSRKILLKSGDGKSHNQERTEIMGKKAALHNLGCKVNAYETEAMQELLEQAGYEIVPFQEKADVYIINTCTVTNMADRKSRQMLHRARKMNPEAVVAACGCYVQEKPDEAADCVDIVIGNNRKKEIVRILEEYENSRDGEKKRPGEPLKDLVDIGHTKEYEELSLSRTAEHTRAYIKVQDGCNQFCSYCIIPYARGRVRSRSKDHVLEEVQALAGAGYQEVVLTGIHLSSYGIDNGEDLLSLILAVHEVEGIRRIRLGSLEPRIITEEFVRTISGLPKMCPHFHLSLQSGCTETLKRMNRRYTAEEYFEKCELLRKYFHEPALTTDVIVGFPGETQEEFEASRAFVDKVDFYETHVFKYSRREGTKAAVMPDQVPEPVKAERSAILLELSKKKQKAYEERLLGTTQEVLIEEEIERDGEIWQVGHTREYVKAGIKSRENLVNQLVPVEIENPFQIIH